jgi:hypothetical protein
MDNDPHQAKKTELMSEVRDLLSVGSVGLYELIWTLNTWNVDRDATRSIALSAAEALIAADDLVLGWSVWSSHEIESLETRSLGEIPPDVLWAEPEQWGPDGRFLCLFQRRDTEGQTSN